MARFVWRLLKVYEMYERRKSAQEQRVQEAEERYRQAELAVEQQKQMIVQLKLEQKTAHYLYLETYDRYLRVAHTELLELEEQKQVRHQEVEEEQAKLREIQQDIDALEKHREKSKEAWIEEEKAIEMKQLDEIGAQRYFRQVAIEQEEAEIAAELAALEREGSDDEDDLDED
jgi:flagellar biosynthesis chaperone FliJ